MKKIFIGIGLISLVALTGCLGSDPSKTTKKDLPTANGAMVPVSDSIENEIITKKVGYIEYEAMLLTEENYQDLPDDLTAVNLDFEQTVIWVSLSNHREDLSAYDYTQLVTLDGSLPISWQEVSSAMGGHHVVGVLIFTKNVAPQTLVIKGLPVGEAVLELL